QPPDAEASSSHTVQVKATESSGNNSSSAIQTVTVTIIDINDEAPEASTSARAFGGDFRPVILTTDDLLNTDPDITATPDDMLIITVTALPVGASLMKDGVNLAENASFTYADL
ncbi:MAG: hypothetical protein J4F41_09040, partial [Alphaproteobacteria bacterium]|nr:hypothetical protein [Alphaproteobacteria bacterium]